MNEVIIGFLGIILGGLMTVVGIILNNFFESKRLTESIEQQNKVVQREDKLNSLHEVLIPIIELYEKSDSEREEAEDHFSIPGRGLNSSYINDVKHLKKTNKRLMSFDLIMLFNRVEGKFNYDMEHTYSGLDLDRLVESGEVILECIFDDDRKFIDKVKEEAEEIRKIYS